MTLVDATRFLPLSQAHFLILGALSRGDLHGYAIMQDVEKASSGYVKMGPATLYGSLKKLCEQGLVEELPADAFPDVDRRRRYYRLTAAGRAVCTAEAARLADLAVRTQSGLNLGPA